MNTIYILWLRQLKRYSRSKSRMIGSFAQPVLFLISLGYGFGHTFQQAGQGSYINFLAPGIISMSIIFSAMFMGMEIIWDRQFGFLKETLVAPVPRMNIMIGRTLGGATVATIQGILMFFISMIAGFTPYDWAMVPFAVLMMILVSVMFTSLGTMIASLFDDMHGFQMIMNFMVMPMFFMSGALFPLNNLPPVILTIARFDPLTYGVDAFRTLLINQSYFGLGIDVLVLSVITIIFLSLGSYFFSKIQI